MRRRTWMSLAIALALLAALATAVYLRKQAPPEVARFLPEADGIVYFNLQPLRTLTRFDQHPVAHEPDYQKFIDATGIVFERDLDQAAFAIHRMADSGGPNGAAAYSEVFQGRFDGQRLTSYLEAQSAATENYAGHEIYSIQHEERTVRVVLLGYELVAVSNAPTSEQIHSIIDRYHSAASPFTGDTLLSRYYSKVPLLSEAWGIGSVEPSTDNGIQFHIFGLPLTLPPGATFIGSIRYLGSVHMRLEEIAPNANIAKESVEMVNLALGLVRSSQVTIGAQDANTADWKAFVRSMKVEQKGSRAIFQAVVPTRLVRSLLSAQNAAAPAPVIP
ncbi:MAG TPA: hypothetical protein VE195_04965 [Acidobacteriaceae bacterium]|nr:hypothetical protein [Acidobacteriaceae bacterium]